MTTRRKNIMLGTAGHVDHGKTALVKLLTGCNTDTLREERERGLTIDLGFAPCRMADDRIVGIVDVPGHADFVRNMVAGAHGIDVVILVVAADDGVMPQTREHLNILTLMGLRYGLVALTKIDLVESEMRELVVEDVRRLLADTFLERAPICPLSNVTGEGFDGFFDALNDVVAACGDRDCAGLFRVWAADVFPVHGFGTIVTGMPVSGVARLGDHLRLVPGDLSGRVRRMEVYGEDAAEGRAGECVALNLPEVDHAAARRGMVVCASDAVTPVSLVEAELRVLPSVKGSLKDYAEVHLHLGTASVLAHVAMLETGEMTAGQSQMVQLRPAEPLGIVPGDRYVIRAPIAGSGPSGLTTIGGGRILGVSNVRLRRRKAWTLETLAARRTAIDHPPRWGELMLKESGHAMRPAEIARVCHWREAEAERVLQSLQVQGCVQAIAGGAYVHRATVQRVATQVLAAIRTFHETNAQRFGIERPELGTLLKEEASLVDLALETLMQDRQVVCHGGLFAAAGRQARVSSEAEKLAEQIAELLHKAGWASPTTEELAASLHESPARILGAMNLLVERGIAARIAEKLYLHHDAVEAGRTTALRLFARAASFSTMEFRDALGVSRKYAVPLLDYLDAIRFTVRSGHTRTPGVEARKRLGGTE